MQLHCATDGGSRGNPGPAAIGAVLLSIDGEVLAEISETIGVATNNQAEYKALLACLKKAKKLGGTDVHVRLDSQLVVRQLQGQYKVKDEKMKPLFQEAKLLEEGFEVVEYEHVKREMNRRADALVNKALNA